MKHFSFLCAALAVAPAMAGELVAHQEGSTIRLADEACAVEMVLDRLQPELHGQFRAASAVVQGQSYAACWRITPAGAHLVYEDGDEGIVPFQSLKPLLSV